jgi:tetratricopeptide (TPR) repeat protein
VLTALPSCGPALRPAQTDDAPSNAEAAQEQLKAARAARRAGNWAEAERCLKECERLKGPAQAVALEHKLLAAQRGDLAGVAKELVAAVRKDHPDAVLILEALAQGYHEVCRPFEEYRTLEEWRRRKPDDPQVLYRLGRVIEQRARVHNKNWNIGPDARPLECYRRAVKADPKYDAARLSLAEGLLEQNHADEALEHFKRLRERRPTDPAPVLGLARCEILLGRTEEGTKLLDRLLADYPRDAQALAERGKVALQEGQAAKAEGLLRRALAQAPSDSQATFSLHQCLLLAGKREEAAATLARYESLQTYRERLNNCLKVADRGPQDLASRPEAGMILLPPGEEAADRGRLAGSEGAVRHYLLPFVEEAADRGPQDPAPRAEAGMILLRLGEEKEGLRWLRSALRVDPKHKPTHRALADYYQRKGDKERAEKHRKLAE